MATAGRIIHVVGINLPNKFLSSPFGPTNRPNGNVTFVNADGSSLGYSVEVNFSSGQQEYPLSGINSTTIEMHESCSSISFQYVNAQIG